MLQLRCGRGGVFGQRFGGLPRRFARCLLGGLGGLLCGGRFLGRFGELLGDLGGRALDSYPGPLGYGGDVFLSPLDGAGFL